MEACLQLEKVECIKSIFEYGFFTLGVVTSIAFFTYIILCTLSIMSMYLTDFIKEFKDLW